MKQFPILAAAILSAAAAPAGAQDTSGSIGVRAPTPVTGQEVYEIICQSCHMEGGKGGAGAGVMPPLANNPRLASPAYPVNMILNGRGAMPWFHDGLSNAQIAGVTTYVRTHFGNNYAAPVTEADVAKLKAAAGR